MYHENGFKNTEIDFNMLENVFIEIKWTSPSSRDRKTAMIFTTTGDI
jgi:hypothetical protein